jgi:mannose-6-phosphate isomerase-like protein (cupin superfamily)
MTVALTKYVYDEWLASLDVPLHKGFFIADTRTVELGYWKERGCPTAFIQLSGQEGVSEARITEIAPGTTLPPYKLAIDEVVYVLSGSGATDVWANEAGAKRSFEWQEHALFLVPGGHHRQLSNLQGDKPVRLLHYNYLPLALTVVPDPEFFLDNPYSGPAGHDGPSYSEATGLPEGQGVRWGDKARKDQGYWYGNFFPDMLAWDRLESNAFRGAGSRTVNIQFPDSNLTCHMSVFPARTYKKAHRHGPGRVIVIPGGEGYSLMWPEGSERVVVPWQEGSLFVPPNRWFHQHFNLGSAPARYLALHPAVQFRGYAEKVADQAKDQIEYPSEDPWIRQYFEEQLAARGLTSLVPDEAYRDPDHTW